MTRHDDQRLADILASANAITDHIRRGGLDDGLIYDAVRIRLIEIGEAGRLLDAALNSLREAVTGFPWNTFPALALPPSESPEVASIYSTGIDFMYASYGLSK